MSYLVRLTFRSGNAKTGPIPVSLTSANTCPPACGVGDDCYAKFHHLAGHWRRVDVVGLSWDEFCSQIQDLPEGMLWRHNEAGDLPGLGNGIDADAMYALVEANRGKRGYTYTHKPVRGAGRVAAENRDLIREANSAGFVVNLSGDTMADADALAELEVGPVTVLLPDVMTQARVDTPAGRPVDVCPNYFDERIQCWFCGRCTDARRTEIIGFPAHGARRKSLTRRILA